MCTRMPVQHQLLRVLEWGYLTAYQYAARGLATYCEHPL